MGNVFTERDHTYQAIWDPYTEMSGFDQLVWEGHFRDRHAHHRLQPWYMARIH